MYRSHPVGTPEARRGIILLVVLFLLTLFAIAGITFVIYADAEAAAARLHRDANNLADVPDMDAELAFSYFLGQLIYDSWDDESGVYSSMRGHSLARTMYGLDTIIDPSSDRYVTSDPPIPPATARTQLNTVPFNGTGRLHEPITIAGQTVDGYNLVNYMYFRDDPQVAPNQRFLRDPERRGVRNPPGLRPFLAPAPRPPDNRGPYTGGFNAPYTYPDLNNMFLAHVRSDGWVTLPSFHRDWTGFGPLYTPGPGGTPVPNPNWFVTSDPTLKYRVLRPRPVDQLLAGEPWPPNRPYFPPPDDPGGDVKNLVNAPGGNDSIWIDIGAPVLTLPGGKKYKMLVAPLIIDLDGRLNVNLHGNLHGDVTGAGQGHVSNQGWGPWEVNLSRVLTGGTGGNEWKNLFLGTQIATPRIHGKYGANQVPTNPGTNVGALRAPHYYAQIDYNGARESGTADRLLLPGFGGAPALSCFPSFPNGRYVNGVAAAERRDHAREYNVFRAVTFAPANDDRVFAASNMAALLRFNDMGSEALTSELLRLCPDNFTGPNGDIRRRLVTTHSFDLNQAGVTPYIYNRVGQPSYASPDPTRAPIGSALDFPPLDWRLNPPPDLATAYPYSEFRPRNWRAQIERTVALSDVGRINLNRLQATASSYPHYRTGLLYYQVPFNGRFDGYDPAWRNDPRYPPLILPGEPAPPRPAPPIPALGRAPTPPEQFGIALGDPELLWRFKITPGGRQTLANALYRRLLAVTGVPPVANPLQPSDPELTPRRWLAQLAVNIVDYIDEDEVITPFNFYSEEDAYPQGRQPTDPPFDIGRLSLRNPGDAQGDPELPRYWVFGTELPKVVVNEVLVEHRIPANPAAGAAGDAYPVHVWVELHNPMQTVPGSLGLVPQTGFPVPFKVGALQGLTSAVVPSNPQNDRQFFPYRVVVANRLLSRPPGTNDNVLGSPDVIRTETRDTLNTPNGPFDFDGPVMRINNTPQPPRTGVGITGGLPSPYIDSQGAGSSGSSFFLIGPADGLGAGIDDARGTIKNPPGGRVPDNTPYLRSPIMKYEARVQDGALTPDDRSTGVTVLLRRLANPHLPPNDQRTLPGQVNQPNPWYNPYITVDYLEAVPLRDGNSPDGYASRGKRQPYAAYLKRAAATGTDAAADSPVVDQELTVPPAAPAQPPLTVHNFGQVNTPLPLAVVPDTDPPVRRYEWLVHLDRELISPPELLHVSGYPPHLLTQRFIVGDDRDPMMKFQHYVPWFDQGPIPWSSPNLAAGQSHRLYRLFEHLQCYDRIAGVGSAEAVRRIPGKINLNSIWDPEVFQALCDAAAASNPNYFDSGDVQGIFDRLMARRSPNYPNGGPGANDRPFQNIAAGLSPPSQQHPPGLRGPTDPGGLGGIEETMLASFGGTDGRRLLQPPLAAATDPASHPYLQMQLLTKIFDQVTTRSNVFAVWATVGFFEVIDDTSRPMKLGAELGRAEGRNIRHRMFAIIDRTQLTQYTGPQARFNPSGNLVLVPYFSLIK